MHPGRWLLVTLSVCATYGITAPACGGKAVIDPGAGGTSGSTSSSAQNGASQNVASQNASSTSSSSSGGFANCEGQGPGRCVLEYRGCCGTCGRPELEDFEAVELSQVDAFHASQCPIEEPCPDCVSCPNGDLFAFCDEGACRGADLSEHPMNTCSNNDDCRLRIGTDCCERCGEVDPFCGPITAIAVNAEEELRDLVCPADGGACPPCAPIYPDEFVAVCVGGFCRAIPID